MTVATLTLADFLIARVAEDEAAARLVEAAPPKWTMTVYPHDGERIPVEVAALSPTRVLAECEAKRRIVERAKFAAEAGANAMTTGAEDAVNMALEGVLELLALPHSDHPDYNPAWRP